MKNCVSDVAVPRSLRATTLWTAISIGTTTIPMPIPASSTSIIALPDESVSTAPEQQERAARTGHAGSTTAPVPIRTPGARSPPTCTTQPSTNGVQDRSPPAWPTCPSRAAETAARTRSRRTSPCRPGTRSRRLPAPSGCRRDEAGRWARARAAPPATKAASTAPTANERGRPRRAGPGAHTPGFDESRQQARRRRGEEPTPAQSRRAVPRRAPP